MGLEVRAKLGSRGLCGDVVGLMLSQVGSIMGHVGSCWAMLGLCWPQTLKKATSKTTQKRHQKQKAPEKPGNEILGALNNTENNPVQATKVENTPSQLALWRIIELFGVDFLSSPVAP